MSQASEGSRSLHLSQVTKEFGGFTAVDSLDLDVPHGSFFALLGPSGCGKTTTLRMVAGLETPTSGSIRIGDTDITYAKPYQRPVNTVFQSYALFPHLDIHENVAFGLRRRKSAEVDRQVTQILDLVELGSQSRKRPQQLSGGQQQRVALARALVVRPKCLLLDEPLSNLDAKLRIEMRREIRRIVKEGGLTAVYVTHDQEEALSMADRMAVMNRGRIEQLGRAEEVYRNPHTAFVSGFIGETNLLKGRVVEVRGEFLIVETAGGPLVGRVTKPDWQPAGGEQVTLSIRPEAWRVDADGGENGVMGKITERSYLGQRIQYVVETPAGPQQVVELNPHVVREPGETAVKLSVRRGDVAVLQA